MEMISLNKVDKCWCALEKIQGVDEAKHKRLIELGFVKGTKLEVIKNHFKQGIVVIGIRGFTLCLDYALAEGVFVWKI